MWRSSSNSESSVRAAEVAVLNAPFDPLGWQEAVQAIADATGSKAAHLLGMGGPLLLPLNIVAGEVPGIERYLGDPRFHGAGNWRVGTASVPMAVQYEAHYAEYRALHDTADYDDAVSSLDIQFGCQSALLLDSRNLLGIALLRSRKDGPCTGETLATFTRLRHQLARAVRVQLALDNEAAETMVSGVAASRCATLLLDRHANLCALSSSAERLFEEDGPLELAGLAVELRDRAENHHLQGALRRLLASDGVTGPVVHQSHVGRCPSRPSGRWRLFAVRLPNRPHCLGFDPHLAVTFKQAA